MPLFDSKILPGRNERIISAAAWDYLLKIRAKKPNFNNFDNSLDIFYEAYELGIITNDELQDCLQEEILRNIE